MPAEVQKQPAAMEALEVMFKDMAVTIELKADGSAVMVSKGQGKDATETGTWKLDGVKLTLNTKDTNGKSETKTADYSNGSFSVEHEENGMKAKMTFKRK